MDLLLIRIWPPSPCLIKEGEKLLSQLGSDKSLFCRETKWKFNTHFHFSFAAINLSLIDTSVWPVALAQVFCHALNCFFPSQNLVFWGIYLNFQEAEITWNSISRTFWIQIIFTKEIPLRLLIKIFPTLPKAHSNASEIFSYDLI
jgi:hypothetical protein